MFYATRLFGNGVITIQAVIIPATQPYAPFTVGIGTKVKRLREENLSVYKILMHAAPVYNC